MSVQSPNLGISGIATGLDTTSLINKIITFDSQPLSLLNNQIAQIQQQEQAWSPLRGLFQNLHDAAQALTETTGWNPQQVSLSDGSVLSATVNGDATSGSYTIQPDEAYLANRSAALGTTVTDAMARAEQDVSTATSIGGNPLDDATTALGYSGHFSLNGTQIDLDGTESLDQVAGLINDQTATTHVRATVLQVYDVASDTTHVALQLQSTQTGADHAITYSDQTTSASGGTLFTDLGLLAQATDSHAQTAAVKQAAQDAHFVVNGISMVSDSNVITQAIPGVTLTLQDLHGDDGSGDASRTTLTLTTASGKVADNVQKFVDAFNKLVSTVKTDTKYDAQTQQGGPLLGNMDLLLGNMRLSSDIQSYVGGAGSFTILAQAGITQQADGTLKFDRDTFDQAWNQDAASVQALFSEEDTGVAQSIVRDSESWLESGGTLDTAKKSWDGRIKQLQDQASTMSAFLQQREAALKQQFNQMEVAISQMQSQARSLTAALSALSQQTPSSSSSSS